MATITSIATGLWSSTDTWDTGTVPVNADDVVIASAHTVTFDVDQTGFAAGVSVTITGTLTHTTASGTYVLMAKTGASITGAGTWNIGTASVPIPFLAKHTITGAAGWLVDGVAGLTMTVYGAEPTTTYVKLTALEPIGETAIAVDTDVTADIWAAGDKVSIADINQTKEVESYTINAGGIAAGVITLTGTGLTVAKSAGAYLVLLTRNIQIVAVGTGTYTIYRVDNLTVGGGLFDGVERYMFQNCDGMIISGGAFNYNSRTLYLCEPATITGGVFTNGGIAFYDCNGSIIEDCLVVGFSHAFLTGRGISIIGGTYAGCSSLVNALSFAFISNVTCIGVQHGSLYTTVELTNCTFTSMTNTLTQAQFRAFNTLMTGVEFLNYAVFSKIYYSESYDHNQVAGAFKAWSKGGVTTRQAVTVPTGYTKAYQTVLEDANNEGYFQKEQSVGAGQSANLDLWLRKSASMTYLPRVQVFLKRSTDPFAGGTPLKTFTMTDSIDTFEQDTYTYSNDGAEDETLVIRFQGKNASGNLFSALTITVLNVDLTSVVAHITDIKGTGWSSEALVSIENHLDDIKGTGWTNESLVLLKGLLNDIMGSGWTDEDLVSLGALLNTIDDNTTPIEPLVVP